MRFSLFQKTSTFIMAFALVMALNPSTGFALQKGLAEDFNGCSTQEDKAERAMCCDSVEEDCNQTCSDQFGRDGKPGGLITCEWDCETGGDSCKDGDLFPEVTITHICRFDQSKDKKIVELSCLFEFEPQKGFKLPDLPNYKD